MTIALPTPITLTDDELVSVFDELPLWSAPFGLALLELVDLRPGLTALDIGCGAGFPLVELAQRLGPTARVHGVDPWAAALRRVRHKLAAQGVDHVEVHQAEAEHLPLADASVDLIVSNNGFNNVADLDAALAECARVARPGAQLVYAYNLPDSMREVYDVYDRVLAARGLDHARAAMRAHIDHKRKPIAFTVDALARAGFASERVVEQVFTLRFADARALFAHFFMRLAFIPSWLELAPVADRAAILGELAAGLDAAADRRGLTLTIPLACIDARRVDAATDDGRQVNRAR